jgi:hypothetical protein
MTREIFDKKGISTVVATVLIVLITVASVTILWIAVLPLIDQVAFVENPNVQLKIERDEYTAYDPQNKLLSLRVSRGSDESNIIVLKFILESEGNSYEHKVYDVPDMNTKKVYLFNVSRFFDVDSISVIPVYDVNGRERESSRIHSIKLIKRDLGPLDPNKPLIMFGNGNLGDTGDTGYGFN